MNEYGAVVGMITESDLLRRAETGTARRTSWLAAFLSPGRVAEDYVRSHARKVDELISGDVISVAPNASLAEVVAVMESRRIKRVPVIDQDRLVGIVARADLVKALMTFMPGRCATSVTPDAQIRAQFLQDTDAQEWTPRAAIDCEVKDGVIELHGLITDERMRPALRVIAEKKMPSVRAASAITSSASSRFPERSSAKDPMMRGLLPSDSGIPPSVTTGSGASARHWR